MAHFAEIDENNNVLRVIVVDDSYESYGDIWCKNLFGGTWLQTSYNNRIRKNFAGIGYKYDPLRDAFIPPKNYESWILDENICQWKAPIEMPNDGYYYSWNENTLSWDKINLT